MYNQDRIFPHFVDCLLTQMILSLAVQKLFSLVRSHSKFVNLNTDAIRILFRKPFLVAQLYFLCLCHILSIYTFVDVLDEFEIEFWLG